MRKFLSFAVMALLLAAVITPPPLSAQADKTPPPPKLKAGETAPDFTLLAFDGKDLKKYSLHDFKGKKNVALAFFVFAFTGG